MRLGELATRRQSTGRACRLLLVCLMLLSACLLGGCGTATSTTTSTAESTQTANEAYSLAEYPLERNGLSLHLERIALEGAAPKKNILLVHGVTYSSKEFDVDYEDYSLARRLAREGYGVWLLDIAGFGRSEAVEDGFLPDTDYAAEDINATVERIVTETGQERIDVLGWSWGTVTVGRFVGAHPDHVGRVVLYAPILCGIGEHSVTDPFHHNTWEHAADDFQTNDDGSFDDTASDPILREVFCSTCWHYDGESSPNGGRRDICVSGSVELIDLERIERPTLVICGNKDPYLNMDLVNASLDRLPKGSELEIIDGASHVAYIEKPYHRDFQDRLIAFLNAA